MTIPALIDQLPKVLAEFPAINLIYLFGSQVTGQVGLMSDIDLAVSIESAEDDFVIQAQLQYALSKILDTARVDVVLLNRAPIELAYHIISRGKLLYQRNLYTRVELEAKILGRYGDYLPVLKAFRQQTIYGDPDGKRVQRYREAFGRTQRALTKGGY